MIPLGASTPLGAAGIRPGDRRSCWRRVRRPTSIILSASSGGTQAGIIAGCRLHGLGHACFGISADDPAAALAGEVGRILAGLEALIGAGAGTLAGAAIEIDDSFVGGGYGVPTPASTEATELCARREALFLDPTYTSKAMAGLIARVRARDLGAGTILFWHTGGQVGLFA